VADLERRPGPGRQIAIAGAIDEETSADRLPAGFGFHEQRLDPLAVHRDTSTERVEENIDLVVAKEVVGRDLVGRGVIGLRKDFAENKMRLVQSIQTIDARKQIGS